MANGTWLTLDALHVSRVTVSCNEIAIISPDYCSTNEIVRGVLEPSSFGLEDFFRTSSKTSSLSLSLTRFLHLFLRVRRVLESSHTSFLSHTMM